MFTEEDSDLESSSVVLEDYFYKLLDFLPRALGGS